MLAFLLGAIFACAADDSTSNGSDSLEVEKLKLQIEELKLENQRLELQIKTLQIGAPLANVMPSTPTFTPTPVKKEEAAKKIAEDMRDKAGDLAKQNASDEHKVVLDFLNGEMWYKGVHYQMSDFAGLCMDQNFKSKKTFLKYDVGGDSEYQYQYRNMYLNRYEGQSKGVFVLEAPQSSDDFTFITPETVSNTSSFSDFRKLFETAYYNFGDERREGKFRVLRFRHGADFLGWDDVLEFWFDKNDNFAKLKWGMLDKK